MAHLPTVSDTKLYGVIIFGAIVIFQIAYILLQWYHIRRREYLFYATYMFGTFVYALEEFEHYMPFALVTDWGFDFHTRVRYALPIFLIFIYYHFSSLYISLKETRPDVYHWVNRFKIILLVYVGFELVSNFAGLNQDIAELIFLSLVVFIVVSSIVFITIVIRKQNALVQFALTGALLLLIGGSISTVFMVLQDRHIYVPPFDPFLPLLIGVIAELLTFTTGLSYKSRMDSVEKIKVQGELIQKLKENEMLMNNMYNIRNKIARDLHDDLGSTLTSISIYSEIGKQKAGKQGTQTKEILNTIGERSREMINNMADIIWAINPQNDSMEALINRMQAFAANVLPASGIKFDFTATDDLMHHKIAEEHRKNIFLIYKEAVHNAIKYARCSAITISLMRKQEQLVLQVTDNGKGFDTDSVKPYSGNGLSNMRQRAMEMNADLKIHSMESKGTEITLVYNITEFGD